MSDIPKIENYEILREIGEGGYGKIYLAKLKNHDGYVALKVITSKGIEREQKALEKFLNIPDRACMAEILDIGSSKDFLYYSSPLADPLDESFQPEDFRWQPKSLQNLIDKKLTDSSPEWFSHSEILEIISPIFDAAIALGESNLLHRDIKPDNILFFGGKAKLSDFGLVDKDVRSLSNIGTPLYIAPSWYVGKGGNPDAYGIAATLYTLISGNLPDTLGRPAYRFPEKEIPDSERERWLHWHRCILRAVSENPGDRYVSLQAFKDAVFSENFESSKVYNAVDRPKNNQRKIFFSIGICALFSLALLTIAGIFSGESVHDRVSQSKPSEYEIPNDIYIKIKENGFQDGNFFIEDIYTWKDRKRSVLRAWNEDFEKSKLLAQKTKEQVLAESEANFIKEKTELLDSSPHTDRKKLEEIRSGEIKLALFEWQNARENLADEQAELEELKDAIDSDEQYKQYVSGEYKKYLKRLK